MIKFHKQSEHIWCICRIDEELIDDEEVDYEDEMESEEDLSDIDDDDLMKRLEAKYGKISGENSDEEDEPDASWTSNYAPWNTNTILTWFRFHSIQLFEY